MLSTPVYGWPYPESGDHTRTWEYWANLAAAIEATVKQFSHVTQVEQSAAQSIPNAAYTALNFDLETVDTSNMHSTSSNTSRLTATIAGWYLLTGVVGFAGNSTGRRLLSWFINGQQTPQTYVGLPPVGTSATAIPAPSLVARLNVGDYAELRAYQDSTAALNTSSAPTSQRAFAAARYICP